MKAMPSIAGGVRASLIAATCFAAGACRPPEPSAQSARGGAAELVGYSAALSNAESASTNDRCAQEISALAREIYTEPRSCTAVVRLAYNTRSILSYQLICGRYVREPLDEARARARAEADTGFGDEMAAMLNPPNPEGEFVFNVAGGDFRGVAAVSTYTGLSVFGGSIDWRGTGRITYPTSWRPAAQLGSRCPPSGGIQSALGYDLAVSSPLPAADVEAALAVVRQTALPAAFWQGGYVFNAVVLKYPRTLGPFDPATAEWIVLVNGGWLE